MEKVKEKTKMNSTLSKALWVAGTFAIVGIGFLILWPMIRTALNAADDHIPVPPQSKIEIKEQYAQFDRDQDMNAYLKNVLSQKAA